MIILVFAVLGLAFGSFINALVWRIHAQEKAKTKQARQKLSITKGRSMCVHCRHELAAKDLVPVMSYIWLQGKCRYCKKPIDDTPLTEVLTPVLFVVSYHWWPLAWTGEAKMLFGFWLVFLVGLIALAKYDLRWFLLPDRVLFPLAYLLVAQVVLQFVLFSGGKDLAIRTIWGFLIGGGIFWLLYQLSDGKWIGGGDVKLGWLLGVLVGGPANSLLLIFIASLLGTAVSLPLLATGKAKRKSHLPFGPFLIAAAIIVQLFGASLVSGYKRQLGLY